MVICCIFIRYLNNGLYMLQGKYGNNCGDCLVLVTSRPPRPGEVNNRDYQFVTRDELEEEAAAGTLVEHGEFKGHLYGTSAITLKSMINAGYVVILTPHYQVSWVYTVC